MIYAETKEFHCASQLKKFPPKSKSKVKVNRFLNSLPQKITVNNLQPTAPSIAIECVTNNSSLTSINQGIVKSNNLSIVSTTLHLIAKKMQQNLEF